ncbi:MAG: hypothetical protein OEY50_03030 [Nitrospinota bacterium]|nr:hypothetical protein [Nitrospinota bacterium]MDH5677050.1 hypothetical protein [Nitrospinota bacterium]MDH5755055.1 hypothetical protein [Nitrospinota bacterium]
MSQDTEKKEADPSGEKNKNTALLVVGTEDGFSPMLMDYSLGLAQRLGYSIVALNLFRLGKREMRRYQGEAGEKLLDILRDQARASTEKFGGQAWTRKVQFKSEWGMGQLDQVTRQIMAREGNIRLVLVEPEYFGESDEKNMSIPTFMYSD